MPFDRCGVCAKVHKGVTSLFDRASQTLFVTVIILAIFTIGLGVGTFKIFPYAILSNAYNTAKNQVEFLTDKNFVVWHTRPPEFVNIDPGRVETHRWEFVAADTLTDPILVPGGFGQFAEYCPGQAGCLAVRVRRQRDCPTRPSISSRGDRENNLPRRLSLRTAARFLNARRGISPVWITVRQR